MNKAEMIFQSLDHENNLVFSCLEYVRKFTRMCRPKGQCSLFTTRRTCKGLSDTVLGSMPNSHDAHSDRAATVTDATWSDTLGSTGTMTLNPEDIEAFQNLSAEMFDPIMFEGMNASPWQSAPSGSALWDGFSLGMS